MKRRSFDNTQAFKEGWGLWTIDEGKCQIQMLDDPQSVDESYPENCPFTSDAEAIDFVVAKANDGSEYHRRALELHRLTIGEPNA